MAARAHRRDSLPKLPANFPELSSQEEGASATRESRHVTTFDRKSPASIELAVRAQVYDLRRAHDGADSVDPSCDDPPVAPVGDGPVNSPVHERPAGRRPPVGSDGNPRAGRP